MVRRSRAASGAHVAVDLVEVATRFYVRDQTQAQIAREMGVDPSTVSRYLKQARDEGIVRIEISRPRRLHAELGLEVAHHFGLRRAVVAAGSESGAENVARAAADYVGSLLSNGMRLGLSFGRMPAACIRALTPGTVSGLEIFQLLGGVGSAGAEIQGPELARHLASLFPGSRTHFLHAPLLVDSADIKRAMLRDGSIREALRGAATSELAIVGIGTLNDDAPLIRYAHISEADRRRLRGAGAVGDICARFFRAGGQPVSVLDDRLMAVEWAELAEIPTVVAMAAGRDKLEPLWGALHCGCLDILVTDEPTASALCRRAREEAASLALSRRTA